MAEIPAEQHTALMQSLANAGSRERWNRGCGHADGEPVLSAEQVAELTPKAPEPTEEAPPQQSAAAPQRVAKPAPKAAAAAAPEPDPAPAESEQEEPGEDSIQRELV